MPKYLAIDYGIGHIGLAISDPAGRIAFPWKLLAWPGSDEKAAGQLLPIIQDQQIDNIVIGLPLNMNGSQGPQAELTDKFARQLGKLTDKPIEFWDERLSSIAAQKLFAQQVDTSAAGRGRKKRTAAKSRRRVDPVAAQIILQACLDSKRSDP